MGNAQTGKLKNPDGSIAARLPPWTEFGGAGSTRRATAAGWTQILGAVVVPVTLLLGCSALFVGSDVLERHLFPALPIGWRHALLTVRAAVVTAAGCAAVYLLMRKQQRRLTHAAERLSGFLESYQTRRSVLERFENPHLVHCREVLGCRNEQCAMFNSPGERCWQIMALHGASRGNGAPRVSLQQCHECPVYRLACPDPLTQLGEQLNNLMFLLEDEARQVGRMRAQMVEREKMAALGQIAAGFAHEVGNPLSSISSIVQMLQRQKSGVPTDEQLALIQAHIRRISDAVRRLVTIARPVADHWELVRLGPILNEAVHLVRFDPRARGVRIEYKLGQVLPQTYGQPDQLQQVFINLLLNALDAMPAGGDLRIRTQRHRRRIVVRIEDTGCGIPPSLRSRVFEPFFTTKPPGQGTGLGLAVSQAIIQKHRGTISFLSIPHEGTTFTVTIPLLTRPPED